MESKRTKSIGVIGCGSIGTKHIAELRKVGAKIVGATVKSPESRKKVSETLATPVFETAEELVETCSPDAVVISSPNYTHASYTIAALEAGCHVLCEKPMATNRHDARVMCQSAVDADRCLMLAHNLRFNPHTQLAAKLCAEGYLGHVYHAKCGWIRNRGIPGLGKWFTTKRLAGGGVLIDLGTHMLDMAWFILGKPAPISVSGSAYSLFRDRPSEYTYEHMWAGPPDPEGEMDVEDFCTAFIRFEGDITLQIEVAWAANTSQTGRYCTLLGEKGGIAWSERTGLELFDTDGKGAIVYDQTPASPLSRGQKQITKLMNRFARRDPGFAHSQNFPTLHQHFLDCLDGADCLSPGSDGYIIQSIIDAIYTSSEKSHQVPVTLS